MRDSRACARILSGGAEDSCADVRDSRADVREICFDGSESEYPLPGFSCASVGGHVRVRGDLARACEIHMRGRENLARLCEIRARCSRAGILCCWVGLGVSSSQILGNSVRARQILARSRGGHLRVFENPVWKRAKSKCECASVTCGCARIPPRRVGLFVSNPRGLLRARDSCASM